MTAAAGREPDEPTSADATGGDPACWAHRVCQACGRLNEAERPEACVQCGEPFDD